MSDAQTSDAAAAPVAAQNVPLIARLTRAQKAAILIKALGVEAAGELLRKLGEPNVRNFARTLAEIDEIPTRVVDEVAAEFLHALEEGRLLGGSKEVKSVLSRIMNSDSVERMLEDDPDDNSIWTRLLRCGDPAIANFLNLEHPQTCAVVLSRLPTDKAARVIARMDISLSETVVSRLSHIVSLAPSVMDTIKQVLQDELIEKVNNTEVKRKPDEMIGAILNSMPGDKRDGLFKSLEEKRPSLAAAVQRKMFTFNDIAIRVEPRQVGIVTRAVDGEALKIALAYGRQRGSPTVEFILANISSRMAEQYEEELAEMPQVRAKDGEESHAKLIAAIRAMADKGELELLADEEEEDGY